MDEIISKLKTNLTPELLNILEPPKQITKETTE